MVVVFITVSYESMTDVLTGMVEVETEWLF